MTTRRGAWINSGKKEPIMATKRLDNARKGKLSDQLMEVQRMTSNGTRPYDLVRVSLQDIIEGRFSESQTSSASPHTVVAERVWQLNLQQGWGFKSMPWAPRPLSPRRVDRPRLVFPMPYLPSETGRSGLYRTFDALWDLIPEDMFGGKVHYGPGFSMTTAGRPTSSRYTMRQVRGLKWRSGIRWVELDLGAYRDCSVDEALSMFCQQKDDYRFAGVEILMAAVLFPDVLLNSDVHYYRLNMAGLRSRDVYGWVRPWEWLPALEVDTRDPAVRLHEAPGLKLVSAKLNDDRRGDHGVTPIVTEC